MKKRLVVKLGGHVIANGSTQKMFAEDMAALQQHGYEIVIVHGGGPQIEAHLKRCNFETEYIDGLRVTPAEVMTEIRMVLTGVVQRDLVNDLVYAGCSAIGISGEDAGLVKVNQRKTLPNGKSADLGLVGDVTSVWPNLLNDLINLSYIPVVSSVGVDENNIPHNINADAMAASVAVAISADQLLLLSDVPGVYANWPDTSVLLNRLTVAEVQNMMDKFEGGMAPKMEATLAAVKGGVNQVHLVDGRQSHACLNAVGIDLERETKKENEFVGTVVRAM